MTESSQGTILVTGVAGFIAYHATRRLLREGYDVLGIDNFDPFYSRELKEENVVDLRAFAAEQGRRFELVERDICDLDDGVAPRVEIAGVLHLAARAGIRASVENPEAFTRTNVLGTVRLLEWCRKRGVDRILFGSSSSVYGIGSEVPFDESARADTPISPYAASKRAAELYCHTYAQLYGLRISALRFFTVYGPRQRPDLAIHLFTRKIAAGDSLTLYGDGTSERDYTHVDDIVDGLWAAWQRLPTVAAGTFEVFNLGGSQTTSLFELVESIEAQLGVEAQSERREPQPGDIERTWADLTRSREALGFEPRVPFAAGLARFVDWFKGR